jgi:hypothetical protein
VHPFFLALILASFAWLPAHADGEASTTTPAAVAATPPVDISSLPSVRGIHVSAAAAGSKKYRAKLDSMLESTIINAIVVDLKDEGGEVYVPDVKMVNRLGAYKPYIPNLKEWIASLKERKVYTIARIVVFKDNHVPRKDPSLGVQNQYGGLWFDRKKYTWLDPYNREGWKYIHLISLAAADLGFDEIQYDYIRFPTDGHLSAMRFSKPYSRKAASEALVRFLAEGKQLLHPRGVKISIDVFGLTTSDNTGMGIGQLMGPMTEQVDYVSPMTYPSHYNPGEYGLAVPNDKPYETISFAMRDALQVLGPGAAHKLRPWLQDFSLKGRGRPYRAEEVRAQIQAAADKGVTNWLLWNASCRYTLDALQTLATPQISSTTEKTSK